MGFSPNVSNVSLIPLQLLVPDDGITGKLKFFFLLAAVCYNIGHKLEVTRSSKSAGDLLIWTDTI